jgi:hypothetical protein
MDEYINSLLSHSTPRAQQVLALARKEAGKFNHNFIGTEHILLGMIRLRQGVAINVLVKGLGLDLDMIRIEVEKRLGSGPDQSSPDMIPFTPRTKKVFSLAQKEAKAMNHTYVGTEHLLLGLLREGDGIAAQVLRDFGSDRESICQAVLKELNPNFQQQATERKNVEKPVISVDQSRYISILDINTDGMPDTIISAINQAKLGALDHLVSLEYFKRCPIEGGQLLHRVVVGTDWKVIHGACVLIYKENNSPESLILQIEKLFLQTVHGSIEERRLGTILQAVTKKPVSRTVVMDFLNAPPPASS